MTAQTIQAILIVMIKSKNKIRFPIIIFIIIIILFLFYSIFQLAGGSKRIEPEIHYIPKNYVGHVRINFNLKDGVEKQTLESSRLYLIPTSGELNTKFSPNYGKYQIESNHLRFYYYDSLTKSREPLVRIDWRLNDLSSIDSNDIVIKDFGYYISDHPTLGTVRCLGYIVDTLKNLN